MKTFEPILETQVIKDTTRNGMRVNIKTDESVAEYISPDGSVIKGTGLIKTNFRVVNIYSMTARIAFLQAQIPQLQAELTALQAELPQIETVVEDKIIDAISKGAKDERN